MSSNWDVYSRQGIDLASFATTVAFDTVKRGTRLSFHVGRSLATTAVGVTTSVVDYALFGGGPVLGPVAGSAVHSAFSLAEQLVLAPIHLSEYLTSTSLMAAHSSINVLSVIFPGSNEASFSLASFITLVKREWSDSDSISPVNSYGLTQVARAVVAWVALQGVTQEWQEKHWFKYLKELDVMEKQTVEREHLRRPRRNSRVRVTSDVIFPGRRGPQIISADIGDAPILTPCSPRSRNSTISSISSLTMTTSHPTLTASHSMLSFQSLTRKPSLQLLHSPTASIHSLFPTYSSPASASNEPQLLPLDELKATLRRLSKMVLAGYGGASLLFFGITPDIRPREKGEAGEKLEEEAKLEVAVDAAEAEAAGDNRKQMISSSQSKYSWWGQLMGRHDQEIFESALTDEERKESIRMRKHQESEDRKRQKTKSTAIVGIEHLMPRFWVLTDYNRGQVVLVIRGTMSLNEIAVDLTCHPEPFQPARTQDADIDEEDYEFIETPGDYMTSPSTKQYEQESQKGPSYNVHSGMLRMAKAMGESGKPVQLAVQEALYHNPGFDLVLCGHSLGAGVAAILGLMWADPSTCLTVRSSGLPVGRRVYVYCFAPPSLVDAQLSQLANKLITSFVYSNDVVTRLSLGSVRNLRSAASWLCEAEEGKHVYGTNGVKLKEDGWSAVTSRARRWKEAPDNQSKEDMDWLVAVRKTLEANMQYQDLLPPGRVLWAMRDSDLHPSHQKKEPKENNEKGQKDKLRLFEVLDVEKIFGQIVFARNMLTAHMPHQYDKALHDLL
ncbi:hypothetical protein AGABI2DRAFT_202200 [Agaricus bisporus var. bisporus H97]|uniref:hypothetical protein n=1 Tax=Agaricus bisporus var. bisporus (strain H97 / ATCC MYA-4626 / FGSC 10389) TaxID=936046 RepID=UPI00029F7E3E|nr:hypothetical protein AGABI2DRAFT_202200 [Agaricus bisporus var. bisporus H97]EKV47937.1 hypothetical protein AGABI2DRAFT_202200 [Agaricus bisporus var. bisporus H97]